VQKLIWERRTLIDVLRRKGEDVTLALLVLSRLEEAVALAREDIDEERAILLKSRPTAVTDVQSQRAWRRKL
jgi:hypothetical protein